MTKMSKPLLFFLDYDGTLTPLLADRSKAALPKPVKSFLETLSGKAELCRVCILSGRALKDVRSMIGLDDLIYAGNHGLEIKGPGISFCHPGALELKPVMKNVFRKLKVGLSKIPGVVIEDKGLSLSVHYRNVPKDSSRLFHQKFQAAQKDMYAWPITWKEGKSVFEVMPKVQWNKGYAAKYLLDRLPQGYPVALGDDQTDEDTFEAIQGLGLAVRIGHARNSKAKRFLKDQSEVLPFLKSLAEQAQKLS